MSLTGTFRNLRASQRIEEKYKNMPLVTYMSSRVIDEYRDSTDGDCGLGGNMKPAPLGL